MISEVITSAHGKDKVIDFRDGLQPALREHYASMHQQGGNKYSEGVKTYPSVIKLYLCDFSKGTGQNSVNVSVNLEPSLPYEWLEVCKMSLGQVVVPFFQAGNSGLTETALGRMHQDLQAAGRGANAFGILLRGLVSGVADVIRGNIPGDQAGLYRMLGSAMKKAAQTFQPAQNQNVETLLKLARGIDYTYSQDKVNVYKKGQDGFAPVSRLSVTRQTFRQDGAAAAYPWVFKVTNGEAIVAEKNTGATTFRSDTMRNKEEGFIRLSDRDVFRMMLRITHFIDAWETAYGIPVICSGEQMREQERQARQQQCY